MPAAPSPLRAAINEALRHLCGGVHDVQPVLVTVFGILNVKTLGQRNNTHHQTQQPFISQKQHISTGRSILHPGPDTASCILVPMADNASVVRLC